jgi:SAM-dependent methyltransferase
VVGIDSRFGALLCARLLARQKGLRAVFRVGVFPDSLLRQSYDIVICLSVLHHMVSTKDIWKVLSSDAFHADLKAMRQYLKELRALVKRGGRCIIEMPYEYSDGASRSSVKFQRFNDELVLAGFSRSQTLGVWAHAARNQKRKDRVLYSAVA